MPHTLTCATGNPEVTCRVSCFQYREGGLECPSVHRDGRDQMHLDLDLGSIATSPVPGEQPRIQMQTWPDVQVLLVNGEIAAVFARKLGALTRSQQPLGPLQPSSQDRPSASRRFAPRLLRAAAVASGWGRSVWAYAHARLAARR